MSRPCFVPGWALLAATALVLASTAVAEDKPPAPAPAASAPDPAASAAAPRALSETTYAVRHQVAVKDLPADAKRVRVWFWMPEDTPEQKVLDFRIVEAPEGVRVTRDGTYGRSWLHLDVAADPAKPPRIVTEFRLLRREVGGMADPAKASPITAEHRRAFARELRLDETHMEVTQRIRTLADELCGAETNPVLQARKCFEYVIGASDHYSVFGPAPKGLCLGDAMECLAGTGDCCTDQHALFIALCRARGIPCRLIYGSRLNYANEGKDYDPGYRCWPRFFAPGLGWLPVDVSSADATKAHDGDRWFGGLDDRRIEWAEGRDFDLEPRSSIKPDLVIRAWVEVDGKVHKGDVPGKTPQGYDRLINFKRI